MTLLKPVHCLDDVLMNLRPISSFAPGTEELLMIYMGPPAGFKQILEAIDAQPQSGMRWMPIEQDDPKPILPRGGLGYALLPPTAECACNVP